MEAVKYVLRIDGRQITNSVMGPNRFKRHRKHFNEQDGPTVTSKYLKFGLPVRLSAKAKPKLANLKEGSEEGPSLDPRLLDQLGTITLTFSAGSRTTSSAPPKTGFVAEQSVMRPKVAKVS
jgi:hypothetical protein